MIRSIQVRCLLTFVACFWLGFTANSLVAREPDSGDIPLGLHPLPNKNRVEMSDAKVELGKQLYFDKRLSSDNTVSCASCHDPERGWSNGEATAAGVGGKRGARSAPSIVNSAYHLFQFWDGRARSLEEQALGPIANPIEMNLPVAAAVKKIAGIDGYREQFQAVFNEPVSEENLSEAIAAFERTILAGDAPYDRYEAGDTEALSETAKRGMRLFFGKANCSACHTGFNFTDNAFHNIGVGFDSDQPDLGRFHVSRLGGDKGAFKTPSLRDVARTAPYMHDGSIATLEEVVEYYNRGGQANEYLDEEIFELNLSEEEQAALVAFLREGLSSRDYPECDPPKLPE